MNLKENMTPAEFASAVVMEAQSRNMNCMIFVDGSKAYVGDLERIYYGKRTTAVLSQFVNPEDLRLIDIFRYAKDAIVDDTGMCKPKEWEIISIGDPHYIKPVSYTMQIYSHKHQINIIRNEEKGWMPIAVFFKDFEDDTIKLYSVNDKGAADYDEWVQYPVDTEIDRIDFPQAFGPIGPIIKKLIKILFHAPEKTQKMRVEDAPKSDIKKGEPVTFEQFHKYLKAHCMKGVNIRFKYGDDYFTFVEHQENSGDYYMHYSSEPNKLGKCLCGFLFYTDAKKLHCRIVQADTEGKVIWDSGSKNSTQILVDGNTRIDTDNKPVITNKYDWHLKFLKHINGTIIRLAIWHMLDGTIRDSNP